MNKQNGRFFYTNRLRKKSSLKLLDECLTTDELLRIVKLNKKQLINAISVSSTREQLHSMVYELGEDKISINKIKHMVLEENDKNSYHEPEESIHVLKLAEPETIFPPKNISEKSSLDKMVKVENEPPKTKNEPLETKNEPVKTKMEDLWKNIKMEIEPVKTQNEPMKPEDERKKYFFVPPTKDILQKQGKTEKEIISIMKYNKTITDMRIFVYKVSQEQQLELSDDFIDWDYNKLKTAYDVFMYDFSNKKTIKIIPDKKTIEVPYVDLDEPPEKKYTTTDPELIDVYNVWDGDF